MLPGVLPVPDHGPGGRPAGSGGQQVGAASDGLVRQTTARRGHTPEDHAAPGWTPDRRERVRASPFHREPRAVLNSDSFLRAVLFGPEPFNPFLHCHRPIIIKDPQTSLGETVSRLKVTPKGFGDYIIEEDIILYWAEEKRVITGSDILGRLLRGIAGRQVSLFKSEDLSTA